MDKFLSLLQSFKSKNTDTEEVVRSLYSLYCSIPTLDDDELVAAYQTIKTCEISMPEGQQHPGFAELLKGVVTQMQMELFKYELDSEQRLEMFYRFKTVTGKEFAWTPPAPPQ